MVARWLGVFWGCRCLYRNVASYRCHYCGKRPPPEVRELITETLLAAERAVAAPGASADPSGLVAAMPPSAEEPVAAHR